MDKISVIVPIYNVEKYLDKCVESIVNQTYENLEIILVDDGSPDNCPKMCDEWAKKDSRIKVIHKGNGGVSSARNAGLGMATGKYISFIDSDDYAQPSMIEIMYNSIVIGDYDVCVCNHCRIDKNGDVIKVTTQERNVFCDIDIIQNFLKTSVFESYTCWTKLYKSSIIFENNIKFDETLKSGEDYYFNFCCFKKAKKMIAIEEVLYNYIVEREGAITDGLNSVSARRWILTKNTLLAEENNAENYRIVLNKYASELACISRELLRSNNKSIIKAYFSEIVDEVKTYYNEFMGLDTINKSVKTSLKLMNFSPKLYLKIYFVYERILKSKKQ